MARRLSRGGWARGGSGQQLDGGSARSREAVRAARAAAAGGGARTTARQLRRQGRRQASLRDLQSCQTSARDRQT